MIKTGANTILIAVMRLGTVMGLPYVDQNGTFFIFHDIERKRSFRVVGYHINQRIRIPVVFDSKVKGVPLDLLLLHGPYSGDIFSQKVSEGPVLLEILYSHEHQGKGVDVLLRDLPAMDDAGTRRGQPSVHCKFDEATAIFKCTNTPPTSQEVKLLTLEGLASDFYLHLAGQAGKLLRDEIPLSTKVPAAR